MTTVQKGDRIKASQFNSLAAEAPGLQNPSSSEVFQRTPNGLLFNGNPQIKTVLKKQNNVLFQLEAGPGDLESVSQYYADCGFWHGIWLQGLEWVQNSDHYFYHSEMIGTFTFPLLIDPTERDTFNLVFVGGEDKATKFPICEYNKAASIGVFQVTDTDSVGNYLRGSVLMVVGDWSILDQNVPGWNAAAATQTSQNRDKLLVAVKSAAVPGGRFFKSLRFLGQHTLVDNTENTTLGFIPINVGQMHIESVPDTTPGYGLSTACLSSIAFTPTKQMFGSSLGNMNPGTFSYSLYNFDRLSADYNSLSAMRHARHPDGSPGGDNELSAFDVLVKHKAVHPRKNAGDSGFDGQAIAKLEYVSLSTILSESGLSGTSISGDTNVVPAVQNSITTIKEGNNIYHQLYGWMGGQDNSHVISASFGGDAVYFPINGIGAPTSPQNAATVLTRSQGTPRQLHYDVYGIKIPKVGPSDITQELYDIILSGGGGPDLSAIKQVVIDTLDDPEAKQPMKDNLDDVFWVQGGNQQNCYGSSIGNSQNQQVVSLDGEKLLHANQPGPNLDWALGHLNDDQGRQSVLWNGRGLVDSTETWALDWEMRNLWDSNNQMVLDWDNKQLVGNWGVSQGNFSIPNGTLTIGNTTLTENQLQRLLALLNP